jgi:hypothetical protein
MMISNKVLSGGTVLVDVRPARPDDSGRSGGDGNFAFDIKRSKRSGSVSTIISKKEPALK